MATIVIAGATGFVGRAVAEHFRSRGTRTIALVRSIERARTLLGDGVELATWNELERAIAEADTVVNLAGENIAAGRWTKRRRALLRSSRIEPTQRIAQAIASARARPRVLVNASAVGYYGNRSDELLTEDSAKGDGFLSDLCAEWEATAQEAERYCRVVRLRLGVVLGRGGGMLGKVEPIVKAVGAIVPGSGQQWLSWIALRDVVGAVEWLVEHETIAGVVNVTAPQPATMADFMRTLARLHRRPVWGRVPEPVLRLALGEMASTLTDSTRAIPARLLDAGFRFLHAELPSALRT